MGFDPLSPVAPAYVNALLLPLGQIKKGRFREFAARVEKESVIRLVDISPDSRHDRATFSPKAFPSGCILYNFVLTPPPSHHSSFSPFEISRLPLLVICIADGNNYPRESESGSVVEHDLQSVREAFPQAGLIQPMIFDVAENSARYGGSITVPPVSLSRITTMKTVMCDISARFLAELAVKIRSIQESSSLETPILSLSEASEPSSAYTSLRSSAFRKQAVENFARPPSPADSEASFRSEATVEEKPYRSSSQQHQPVESGESQSAEGDIPKRSSRSDKLPRSERAKIKLKTRQNIVLGSFYLVTGRWADAFRELAENTNRTKAFADHRWHAKGLEYILSVMLLLAWNRMEFSIPQICYAQQERPQSSKNLAQGNAPTIKPSSQGDNGATLEALSSVLPIMIDAIYTAHSRASENRPDLFPPTLFSDTMIRLTCLYALLYRNGGKIDQSLLDLIVLGRTSGLALKTGFKTPLGQWTKQKISSFLFLAYPSDTDVSDSGLLEKSITLAKISAVLALAGLRRKRAMVLRDMFSIILARPRLAATDFFSHSKSLLNTQLAPEWRLENSMSQDELLTSLVNFLLATYGISNQEHRASTSNNYEPKQSSRTEMDVDSLPVISSIVRDASYELFGNSQLKRLILRQGSEVSSLRGDDAQSLIHAANILRLGDFTRLNLPNSDPKWEQKFINKPLLLPEAQIEVSDVFLQRIEQISLSSHGIEAAYWNRFLLRGINPEPYPEEYALHVCLGKSSTGHQPTNLKKSTGNEIFVRNSAAQKKCRDTGEMILVAEESARLLLTLENPFDFDSDVEQLTLLISGGRLEHEDLSFTLKASSFTKVILSVKPTQPGVIKIHGCRAKITGCREENFLIYRSGYTSLTGAKIKAIGLDNLPSETSEIESSPLRKPDVPKPTSLKIRILPAQPMLELTQVSKQSFDFNVLDGEPVSFSITLSNNSAISTCNYLRVAFESQTGSNLGSFMDPLPLKWINHLPEGGDEIPAGGSFKIDIEADTVLTNFEGLVVIDYAYVKDNDASLLQSFYARQIKVPMKCTVSPSVRILDFQTVLQHQEKDNQTFILLIDLKNENQNSLWVFFKPKSGYRESISDREISHSSVVSALIQSGQVARLAISLPRLSYQAAWTGSETSESVLARVVHATWQDSTTNSHGQINLAGLNPTLEMLDIIRKPEVDISIRVSSEGAKFLLKNSFACSANEFLNLTITLANNTLDLFECVMRIEANCVGFTRDQQIHHMEYIVWTGPLEHYLQIKSQSLVDVILGAVFMTSGRYTVQVTVLKATKASPHAEDPRIISQGAAAGASFRQRPVGSTVAIFDVCE